MRSVLMALTTAGLFSLFLSAAPATAAPANGAAIGEATTVSSMVQEARCRVWRRCWHGRYSGRRCRVWRRCW